MKKQKYYILDSRKRGGGTSRTMMYIYGGIGIFLVIFPFIIVNLRFQTGFIFSKIFDYIGRLCLIGGGFFTGYSILSIFIGGRHLNLKMLTTGIVLLWIGCWLTGEVLSILGIQIGDSPSNPGYH